MSRFNGIGSLEIRAVTDADKEASQRFNPNLLIALSNLGNLLRSWLEIRE
jgi:hypothetical protein